MQAIFIQQDAICELYESVIDKKAGTHGLMRGRCFVTCEIAAPVIRRIRALEAARYDHSWALDSGRTSASRTSNMIRQRARGLIQPST
jgi:hypothetical protein